MGPAQLAGPVPQGRRHPQTVGQARLVQGIRSPQAVRLGFIVLDLLLQQGLRVAGLGVGQGGQVLLELAQHGVAVVRHGVLPAGLRKAALEPGQQQTDQGQPLVEGGVQQPGKGRRAGFAGQDLLHAVVVPVLVIEVQIGGKVLGDLLVLEVLPDNFLVGLHPQRLVGVQQVGQVLPAAGGDELGALHVGVDLVEVLGVQFQITQDGPVDAHFAGVFPPGGQVGLDVHPADAVQGDDVEIPDRLVVLGRIACRHDHPAGGHRLVAEGLALQKLQHGGGQRLGDAVDLVNEQDALLQAGGLHLFIDGGDDLAHGVLRDRDVPAAVVPLPDKGQAHGALAGVVGDGVGHQRHPALPGGLLQDLGLADARRAHQQNRALAHRRDGVFPQGVLGQIGFHRPLDFFFCAFDIHSKTPYELFRSRYRSSSSSQAADRSAGACGGGVNSSSSSTTFMAQGGTPASSNLSPKKRNAAS